MNPVIASRKGSPLASLAIFGALLLLPARALASPTYYVDGETGDDGYTETEAQNPATPWRTISHAVTAAGIAAGGGHTIVVAPGEYHETVESKRDGLPGDPIVIRATTAGTATLIPPIGSSGFFVSHDYHVIEGFVVTGAKVGLQLGPHDGGDGPVTGLVARQNTVHGNTSNGISFNNAIGGEAAQNEVYENGQNGIVYDGDESYIHDNHVHHNAQFGIYVPGGVGHRVWPNDVHDNGVADLKIHGDVIPPSGRTFYVDATNGDDGRSDVQATNPATPWRTINKALREANPGDLVLVQPGTYEGSVESVRDGNADAPIIVRAAEPGTAVVTAPGDSAFFIGHDHITLDGFAVTGSATGLQLGPRAKTNGVVSGHVVKNCVISNNTGAGIRFTNVVGGSVLNSVISNNGKDGIRSAPRNDPSGAAGEIFIFNNLLYGNGWRGGGDYGISLQGPDYAVVNNTVTGHTFGNGGLRVGLSSSPPSTATVTNNIITGNTIGVKEPGGSSYTGHMDLDYNDVWGNPGGNYALSSKGTSTVGPSSISADPVFVDAASDDYRLGRVTSGQPADSPAIDAGSDTAESLGLAAYTAFTDELPDGGVVDLGYHPEKLQIAEGTLVVEKLKVNLKPAGSQVGLKLLLTPGPDSDGVIPGLNFVEVSLGELTEFMGGYRFEKRKNGRVRWQYRRSAPGVTHAVLQEAGGGAYRLTAQMEGLDLVVTTFPAIQLRIGDDWAATDIPLRGQLRAP